LRAVDLITWPFRGKKGSVGWATEPDRFYDVVFRSAAFQWVDDHAAVFSRLLSHVAPRGAFSLQTPGYCDASAHRIKRKLAASPLRRDRFPTIRRAVMCTRSFRSVDPS
jgi:trans-aconitate methyltransferase